jgi:hypothetical protein
MTGARGLSAGCGDISHVVALPLRDCGPNRNQTGVDDLGAAF